MKHRIDLEKAAEVEAFGALALRSWRKHRSVGVADGPFTSAQSRALSDLARSMLQIAKEAGAQERPITIGGVSFELRENGVEEVLSIRTGSPS